jgi:uncharacterized repeat protein (TIGR01451 family)
MIGKPRRIRTFTRIDLSVGQRIHATGAKGMVHSQRIKILGLIVLLLVPYAAMGSFMVDPPEQIDVFTPSQGEDWLTGWHYRKSHTITGSAGAGTDYQIRITVHRTTGTDSGENVYLDSHCQTNFGDVRFTDNDGDTELDYWMEEKTDSDNATFWIEVKDDLGSNAVIYVYYGTPGTTTTSSSGNNTFLFYEDWATQSVRAAVWDVVHSDGSISWSSADATQGGYVAKLEGNAGGENIYDLTSDYDTDGPVALMFRANLELTVAAQQVVRVGSGWAGAYGFAIVQSAYGYNHQFHVFDDDGNGNTQTMDTSHFGAYHTWDITRDGTYAKLYIDGVLDETASFDPDNVVTNPVAYLSCADSEKDLYVDWVAARKYLATEPAHSTWGAEEPGPETDGFFWLSGWDYRQSHIISGVAGAGVNYQIRIHVEYGSGSSSGDTVYCESHCQTNFGDIRFTDNDGDTQLDYWMEEKTDGDDATFWVEVVDDLGSDQVIYVYYGTTGTTTTISSGANTFPLFDDFNRADSDAVGGGWTDDAGNGDNDILSNTLHTVQHENEYCHIEKSFTSLTQYVVRGKLKQHSLAPASWKMKVGVLYDATGGAHDEWFGVGWRSSDVFEAVYHDDGLEGAGTPAYVNLDDTWCYYEIRVDSTNVAFYYSLDGASWTLIYEAANPFAGVAPTKIIIGKGHQSTVIYTNGDWDNSYVSAGILRTNYADDVFVRKYVETEPSHSTWGAEESVTITGSTTTSVVFVPVEDPLTLIATVGGISIVGLVVVAVVMRSRKGPRVGSRAGIAPREERLPSESRVELPIEKPPPRVPREITPARRLAAAPNDVIMAIRAATATPRVIERRFVKPRPSGPIQVATGFDAAGENLKLAVKVRNTGELTIAKVQVILDVPDGFKFVKGTTNSQNLGTIAGGGFQSAIFWLRPQRCVDGEYSGTIIYKDAKNKRQTMEIPSKRLVNICPMLSSTERADEVFTRLKAGSLSRNCASFEFSGGARSVFMMANARLSGLIPVDHSEHEYEDGVYLGYSYYVGETKYGKNQFASEIQVSGTPSGGVLTLSIYSDDERILSGFFVDVLDDVRKHVEILEEKMCPVATCAKCGASLSLDNVGKDRIYRCDYCGAMGKIPPWMD